MSDSDRSAEARVWAPEDLRVGLTAAFDRAIGEDDVLRFAAVSGDHNPLHVDSVHGAESSFGQRIAHGALQFGLASAMIGMHLPGRDVLLVSSTAKFPNPLRFPSAVRVQGQITAWNLDGRRGSIRVTVLQLPAGIPTAEFQIAFTLHERSERAREGAQRKPVQPLGGDSRQPVVMITGAAGGLGASLTQALSQSYRIVALHRAAPLSQTLLDNPAVYPLAADLSAPGWEEAALAALGGAPLFAVIHAAWPGMPRGGLLSVARETLQAQLSFGVEHLIALARFLAEHVGEGGGRLIALGSVAGARRPALPIGSYSLGKGALEATVKLLAPELGRKQICANAVCPGFVPVGMNREAGERRRKVEASTIPLGRVCEPDDVVGLVRYLLSPEASFVSGQVIALDGGQL